MTQVTLNSDLGESFGLHSFGNDEPLMQVIDAANIACGFHSGDPETLRITTESATSAGVATGAHPGLPDPVGFGRREMKVDPVELESIVLYQVGALAAFLKRSGGALSHIKPHGAMYGMVGRDAELMEAIARVAMLYEVPIFGLAGTQHQFVAEKHGIPFVSELYVDLDYKPDGSLNIVRKPHTTDPDAAAARVRRALRDGVVTAIDGTDIPVSFGSVCVHSDTSNSVAVATAVAAALAEGTSAPNTDNTTDNENTTQNGIES